MDAIDKAVEVLNRLHDTDPSVMQALVYDRVPCNDLLAADPTIQVAVSGGKNLVGILGIINGLFGIDDLNRDYICAHIDSDKRILGFTRTRLFKDR